MGSVHRTVPLLTLLGSQLHVTGILLTNFSTMDESKEGSRLPLMN